MPKLDDKSKWRIPYKYAKIRNLGSLTHFRNKMAK